VGVDVFFVISGFLMTGIVVKGLEAERFSLLGFYLARARRIVPALWVLCACLLVLGWFGSGGCATQPERSIRAMELGRMLHD